MKTESLFLIKGIALGLSIAAPVGPIGVLCIRRTLSAGLLNGLVTGLGAATADCLYGMVAGVGLTTISSLLLDYQIAIRLIGGSFLVYLGVKIFMARVDQDGNAEKSGNLAAAYSSSLLLTITNPATILSFIAVFAGLGIGSAGSDYVSAALLVTGVFFGSALWWVMLSSGVNMARGQMTAARLIWVNRISGIFIFGFALAAFLSVLRRF